MFNNGKQEWLALVCVFTRHIWRRKETDINANLSE